MGEVMNAGLPTGLKLSSESKIQLHPEFSLDESNISLNDKELMLIKSLEFGKSMTYPEAAKLLEVKNIYHILKSLINKNALLIYEEIKEKYKPKKEKRARISIDYLEEAGAIEEIFEELESKPKQLDVLMRYLQLVPIFDDPDLNEKGMEKKTLLKNDLSISSYNTLVKNKILDEFEIFVPRFDLPDTKLKETELSKDQVIAINGIKAAFIKQDTVLFHGITGSGKTEIYVSLINEQIAKGKQVLYLLPEIALTTQIVERLLSLFGNSMGVYHSKYSDNERVEVWKGVITGRFNFVVGVRSAVFLPFQNLGLIIVDEEQETSYKQQEPAPRYHARDIALYMSSLHKSKTLLGSATPSLESFFLSQQGKYGYVTLDKRYGTAVLPEIKLVNIRQERKNKSLKNNFSSVLIEEIKKTLEQGKNILLFQNRRGYSPFVICNDCGWIPQCDHCAVSLTYHMYNDELRCHYCGYKSFIPSACKACGSTSIQTVGFGTEKIEEDIQLFFPEARVKRMDLDTTRSRFSYQQIINKFDTGEIDILIGTQMISKGLDFGEVTLVGIMDADQTLNYPDFRAVEKTYQMMSQVGGRAGRRDVKGLALVQTSNPEHPVFRKVIENDFKGMAEEELIEREKYTYPPYSRVIDIMFKHKDKEKAAQLAFMFSREIKLKLGAGRILGPEEPLISKIRNEYLQHILIKLERGKVNLSLVKVFLAETAIALLNYKEYKSGKIVFNVDPV